MLISTKTYPPPLKINLLDRRHLIDRLSESSQNQLTIITGPAGYGKTSLAAQWANQLDGPIAWYSIDELDNDPDLFFRYFMTALVNGQSELKKELNQLLLDRNHLTADDVIPAIIHAVSSLSQDMVVVLDDFHLITDNAVYHALARLLKYIPPNIHILIISRHVLPQTLERFKLQYDVMEISVRDLKFSEAEAIRFFKEVIPLELAQRQIKVLTRIARGWVTGFQIFGLWQKNRKLMERPRDLLKITGRESIDYLINEVVKSQPEKIKTFLYQTAGLNRLNADICRYVTGKSDAEKILVDLHRRHLFIIPLDPKHAWYRYHHLFSHALREWIKINSPGMLEQTQKKAAMWCAENQYIEEAFQYAFESKDFQFLADLLERSLFQMYLKFEIVSAFRWLSKVPREVFSQRPILRLSEYPFKILKKQLTDAEAVLSEIEEQFNRNIAKYDAQTQIDFRNGLSSIKMLSDAGRDIFSLDIQKANTEIKKISRNNKLFADLMKIRVVAEAYYYRGELTAAEKEIKTGLTDSFSAEYVNHRVVGEARLSSIKRMQGRLNQAEKILFNAMDYLKREKLSDSPIKSILDLHMAGIFYERNELDKALEYGLPCLRYLERAGVADAILAGYFFVSTTLIAKGDLKKAMYYAEKSKTLADSLDYPSNEDYTEILLFMLSVRMGNFDVFEKQISLGKPDPTGPLSIKLISETMLLAVSLLFKGRFSDASQLLNEIKRQCIKKNYLEPVLSFDIMLSGINFFTGKKDAAISLLEHAIRFSEKEGYIRPFVDYAVLIFPLLKELHDSTNPINRSDYFKTLFHACAPRQPETKKIPATPPSNHPYNLTQRELEILEFVSAGYKNSQIADMAFISLSTVKTHIQHILKKLNAKNRTQAALIAKEFLYTSKES